MVALLVFIMVTLEMVLGQKRLFEAKGPFGGNVIKNPARPYRLFCPFGKAMVPQTPFSV